MSPNGPWRVNPLRKLEALFAVKGNPGLAPEPKSLHAIANWWMACSITRLLRRGAQLQLRGALNTGLCRQKRGDTCEKSPRRRRWARLIATLRPWADSADEARPAGRHSWPREVEHHAIHIRPYDQGPSKDLIATRLDSAKLTNSGPWSTRIDLGMPWSAIAGDTFENASTIVRPRSFEQSKSYPDKKFIAQTSFGACGVRRSSRCHASLLRADRCAWHLSAHPSRRLHMNASVAIAHMRFSDFAYPLFKCSLRRPARFTDGGRLLQTKHRAAPTDRDLENPLQIIDQPQALSLFYKHVWASITLSMLYPRPSASACRSLSCFSRLATDGSSPSYFLRQRSLGSTNVKHKR